MADSEARGARRGNVVLAAAALGFALGGFFDGILLHQILQWHHLLSGLPQAAADLRFLVMTDGLFHLLMYLVAALGLGWLWRGRSSLGSKGIGSAALAWGLMGFGAWHVVDAVLSHWLLGIHRIRMDSDMLLLWDIAWLLVFGLAPILIGLWVKRQGAGRVSQASPLVLALITVAAGSAQALPATKEAPVVVLFREGLDEAAMMEALAAVDGRLTGHDATGTLWVIDVPHGASAAALYAHGALLVSRTWLPVGCLDYTRPNTA